MWPQWPFVFEDCAPCDPTRPIERAWESDANRDLRVHSHILETDGNTADWAQQADWALGMVGIIWAHWVHWAFWVKILRLPALAVTSAAAAPTSDTSSEIL